MSRHWSGRVPLRLRLFFRGVFLLLALSTVGLALTVLKEEKQQRYLVYRDVFARNVEQITARLQHPAGQLALINPAAGGPAVTPLRPLLLPFSGIDFDDRSKAQQAVEMAGCLVQYPDQAQLCVSVGNSPSAGGFIYAVGAFMSGPLTGHVMGDLDLSNAHRLDVEVALRGRTYRWLAPLETTGATRRDAVHGRLTGFEQNSEGRFSGRPDKEFRGWLWQDARCLPADPKSAAPPNECRRRSFYSVRLPVEVFKEDLYGTSPVVWPPADIGDVRVHVRVLGPGDGAVLFDSNVAGASAPFSLSDLRSDLPAGETLRIRRSGAAGAEELALLSREDDLSTDVAPPWLLRIIRRLPVAGADQPLEARKTIATPIGDYDIRITGDTHSVDRRLGAVAARLSGFAAAMLAAILLAWLGIELPIIRRISLLTKRAAAVRKSVYGSEGLVDHDLQDLRGRDELGLLAGVIADLLQRLNEDVKREQIRVAQEKDMWHAVGHEIMSPLQSLLALHPAPDDPSLRYIERMRKAVRVLYGSAPPSEAILSASLQVATLDIRAFLRHVAANAADAGIANVKFADAHIEGEVIVRADEHSLEDVIAHVLGNADRHRVAGSPIRMELASEGSAVTVHIANQGPAIDPEWLKRIFEYGVTAPAYAGRDLSDEAAGTRNGVAGGRGQGLFVARTYMAKMGGTIDAHNIDGGVKFRLAFRAA